jgi:hypothetical protein
VSPAAMNSGPRPAGGRGRGKTVGTGDALR